MKFLTSLLFVVFLISCGSESQDTPATDDSGKQETQNTQTAEQLVKSNCYTCHKPDRDMVGPSMTKIRKAYKDGTDSKEEFMTAMTSFLKDPTVEKSLMPDAVEKYGLMPKAYYTDDDLKIITDFIYETEFNKNQSKNEVSEDAKKGQEIAMATKKVLGKNLITAINEKGTAHALEFCNSRAIPLTDSMSTALNASVRRVSDKPRNPNNEADYNENIYIAQMKQQLESGDDITPIVVKSNGKLKGYYPIVTNQMCLQCHGTPNEELKAETIAKIKGFYPEDKATGYKANQLRGMWVIEWDEQKM